MISLLRYLNAVRRTSAIPGKDLRLSSIVLQKLVLWLIPAFFRINDFLTKCLIVTAEDLVLDHHMTIAFLLFCGPVLSKNLNFKLINLKGGDYRFVTRDFFLR